MSGQVKKVLSACLWLLLSLPGLSYADWSVGVGVGDYDHRHHDWDRWHEWHEHPRWGYHEHYLSPDCYTIWDEGIRYHYCNGLYYSYVGYNDYVLVNPPMGAYVAAIPPDFHPVLINGLTYYTDNGVYYLLTPRGYRVVPPPVVYQQPVVVQQPDVVPPPAPPTAYGQDSFTVNVPNNSGGYTTVVIKRSGKGYAGPQGEYYAEFPKVSQLKTMYVK